jgi:DNA adenine methylase Dam
MSENFLMSPLNYTGGKYKLLPQILPYFPKKIKTFVDLFCGGCNVGINVTAQKHIYNDRIAPLISLYSIMKDTSTEKFVGMVNQTIRDYGLSDVKANGYDFYHCNSANGLSSFNKDKYLKLRADFNCQIEHNEEYYVKLYVLIVFAFNNQIRFNRKGEFNLPPGKRDFNQEMNNKLITFMQALKGQKSIFLSSDFTNIDFSKMGKNDFVYADPPYLITCASYNEQDGWNEKKENELLGLLDELSARGIRFALSNVLESKGKTNEVLLSWINNRPDYKLVDLNYSYRNANYQRRNKDVKTREILITNQ